MKKLILAAIILLASLTNLSATAKNVDYEEIYRSLEVPTHQYVHGVDPGEYYETKTSTWSPYPLFRLASPMFFKSITIEPGYYTLTPREYKDKWYMLFKEAGKVKYIIPVYDREVVPMGFYDSHLPQAKLSISQRWHLKALDAIGRHFDSSKRTPTPQTYLEATDLENHYLSLVIYWGNYRYYTIFRTIQL